MRVLVTGANGSLGRSLSAVAEAAAADTELVFVTRREVDLESERAVTAAIERIAPDAIVHTAAFVGGIQDKMNARVQYLETNLRIDANVFTAARANGVSRLLYIGSSAMYPESAPQPITESALLTQTLEAANEPYALAKLISTKRCEYYSGLDHVTYRAIVPSNIYGPYDRFELGRAHVVASALRKTADAIRTGSDEVLVWGTGKARRELTYAPDLARWILGTLTDWDNWPIWMNLGSGLEYSIREIYETAAEVCGFAGELVFDSTKPEGASRRLLDSGLAGQFGWHAPTALRDGMRDSLVTLMHLIEKDAR